MVGRKCDMTVEQLIEALETNKGFILASQRYLKKRYGLTPATETMKNKIQEWGLTDWLTDIRRELVENCMQKAFHKGIADGDNHCIFWVLDKYGHHIDYLDGKDSESESKKGWKELLEHVKGNTKSETNQQPA